MPVDKRVEDSWDGKHFWVVLNANGRLPDNKFKRHSTKESAEAEAARLANATREPYLVLGTVSGFQPPLQVEPVIFKE